MPDFRPRCGSAPQGMTIVPDMIDLDALLPAVGALPALRSGTAALFPGPAGLHDELARRLAGPARTPGVLRLVGLLRRDDTWPTPVPALDATTARSAGAGTVVRHRGVRWRPRDRHPTVPGVRRPEDQDADRRSRRRRAPRSGPRRTPVARPSGSPGR